MSVVIDSVDKRTIVRSLRLPAPLRLFSGAVSALSPELGAIWAEQLFLTVPRFPVPPREAGWLAEAEPLELGRTVQKEVGGTLADRRTPVRGWSWGDGPIVLLAHGWAGRASQMGAFGVALAAAGFRAIAFDAPGHGASGGRQSSLPAMAETLLAAERSFGSPVGYVAHSAGAAALLLAARGGLADRPGILLAAPAEMETFLPEFSQVVGVPVEVAQIMRQRIERRFGIRWSDLRPATLTRWAGAAPLLVVSDARDAEVPCEHGEQIAAARPAARFERTIGLGHRRILRDPGVVDRAVRFLVEAVRPEGVAPSREPSRGYAA